MGLAQFVRVCLKVIAAVVDSVKCGFGVDVSASRAKWLLKRSVLRVTNSSSPMSTTKLCESATTRAMGCVWHGS